MRALSSLQAKLIIAFVSLVVVGALSLMGPQIANTFTTVSNSL